MKKSNYTIELNSEFIDYCRLNNIDEVEKFAEEVFQKGFTQMKYGKGPFITEGKEQSNNKKIETPRPEVKPAPQTIKKENNLYDE